MITPEGDYLSNLQAPDLRPYFKHLHWRQMGHSMGHLVASDWSDKADDDPVFGLYKKCGLWTRDEAAILWHCATGIDRWVDIGAHTGWTTAHLGQFTYPIEPMFTVPEFRLRFCENMRWHPHGWIGSDTTSAEYFKEKENGARFADGFCIDGDHEPGAPLQDAQNAYKHLADTGVLIFHDFIGGPVREAVTWLMDQGMKARVYFTPHMVACCWRGNFEPPVHEPDKRINWYPHMLQMRRDFDFGRLS